MSKSLLVQYIEKNDNHRDRPKLLPFIHSCEGYNGKKIIEDNELKATHCKVFNENLLYFFYGKPSYPIGEKNETKRTDDLYCPVCFIVDPRTVSIDRVFPFDTGAFKGNRYIDFLHRGMELEDFELDSCLDTIKTYISVIFNNNRNYIDGIACKQESEYLEIDAFLNLLNAKGSFVIDERANTVEVITKKNIDIKSTVKCIILPKSLIKRKEIYDFIIDNAIKYKTYNVRRLTAPMRYNETVFELVMEHLVEEGVINE